MKPFNFDSYEGRQRFYQSKEWRTIREFMLSKQPLCIKCHIEGKIEPATEIDHIIPLRRKPELCLDTENLMPLCKSHHSQKTFEEAVRFNKIFKPAKLLWN